MSRGTRRRMLSLGTAHGRRGFHGTGAADFDPRSVAGLTVDLWADAGISESGTGISSWVCQQSGADFTQGTDGKRPTYISSEPTLGSRPCVHVVEANDDGLNTSGLSAGSSEWTLYVFGNLLTDGATEATQYLFDSQTGRIAWCMAITNGQAGFFDGGNRGCGGSATTGAHVWTFVTDATNGEVFEDGVSLGNSATVATAALGGTSSIGFNYPGNATTSVDMKIGRLLIYAGQHDADTRAQIEAWGTAYYGM